MGALKPIRIVKEREHRVRLELTLPHYGCGILAAGRPVLITNEPRAVGPEGLEPSPTWLRARHAAANTLIPIGAGRTRTLTLQIKSLLCCRYTTTPYEDVDAFEPHTRLPNHDDLLLNFFTGPNKIAGGGVEPPLPPYQSDVLPLHHRAFRHLRIPSVGTVGIEPTLSCSQDTRAPGALHPVLFFQIHHSGPYGSRTHLPALKGRYPLTDRRTSRTRAPRAQVGREALESSSPGFQPGANPSQLPTLDFPQLLNPNPKKARCRCDTGP